MKLNLPTHQAPTLLTSHTLGTPSHGLTTWKFGGPHGEVSCPVHTLFGSPTHGEVSCPVHALFGSPTHGEVTFPVNALFGGSTHGEVSFQVNAFCPVRFPTHADAQAAAFPHADVLLTAPSGPIVFQPRLANHVSHQIGVMRDIPKVPLLASDAAKLSVDPAAAGKEFLVDEVLSKGDLKILRKKFKADLPLGGIGRGAFGTVYRARRSDSDVEFAVKMIEGASRMMAPIAREIEILEGVKHPSIVNLVDVIEEKSQDWMFIVMEFVQGGDLLERLTQQPKLFAECLTRVLFFHICCGLAYAHYQGILHRDIKPENVLLCADGFPKLADFGLSRRVEPGEFANTLAGTPFYKAPEVMQHEATIYDFPADVFSTGNLLLDMLHPEVCMVGIFNKMSDKEKTRFRKRWQDSSRPRFTATLKKIQLRMSDQLPGKRGSMYQTCQELLELARTDSMPHPFWNRQTQIPNGPPKQRNLSRKDAAEIAGRLGYALHCGVNVFLEGRWHPGYVKLISENLCPGALTICFQLPDGKHKETLVCPWEVIERLRPNPKAVELFQISPRKQKSMKEAGDKRSGSSTPKRGGSSTPRSQGLPTAGKIEGSDKQCCSTM